MYIKHKLKNGIELDFDDQNHIYYCNGEKVESVTGICGKGIPKPQLVNWLVYTPIREIKESINHIMDNGKTLDRVSLERIIHQATNKTEKVKVVAETKIATKKKETKVATKKVETKVVNK